ncbi:MAG: BlaI/MecI/CopY family transcriptional regulator [Tenuifilaceae bacterium]
MKQLTKAEEQVMQILWNIKEGIVKDVVDSFNDPKPAYTTVATVFKVLENKGFVEKRKIGNTHLYKPLVSKEDYTKLQFSSLLTNYFNGSFPKMATFFARENKLSITELEDLLKITEEELKKDTSKQ